MVAAQNPLTSFADDVAATKRAVALQDGPVLLVGHSYGGVVITEAGNDPKVAGLVYVAAVAPSDGESLASVSKTFPPAPLGSELRLDMDRAAVGLALHQGGHDDVGELRSQLAHARRCSALAAIDGEESLGDRDGDLRRLEANDRAVPPELEKTEAAAMKATSITLPSSHLVMLSHPKEVAELIEQAAKKAATPVPQDR